MKNTLVLILIVATIFLLVGCNTSATEIHLPNQEDYLFDRVLINTFGEYQVSGELEMWEYVNEDTLLIRLTTGKTYMTDKVNVTFIANNQSND